MQLMNMLSKVKEPVLGTEADVRQTVLSAQQIESFTLLFGGNRAKSLTSTVLPTLQAMNSLHAWLRSSLTSCQSPSTWIVSIGNLVATPDAARVQNTMNNVYSRQMMLCH